MSFYPTLDKICSEDVFVTLSNEIADFTAPRPVTVTIATATSKLDIPLPFDPIKLKETAGLLFHCLSGPNRIIIAWNIKPLFTYIFAKLGTHLNVEGHLFDLRVIEWYEGVNLLCPKNFKEAKSRLINVTTHPSWGDLKNIYSKIYLPLIKYVIPEIEATGIMDSTQKKRLHPYYVIDGQINGRMKCSKDFAFGYNPHSTLPVDRVRIKPSFFDSVFVYLDYKQMEVSVLQWLSQDPVLGAILDSGEDVYSEIWQYLMGTKADAVFRERCKDIFLPVVFGLGAASFAKKWGIPKSVAGKLIDRIYNKFPTALEWIQRQQDSIVGNFSKDVYGRVRFFEDQSQHYLIRNFVVQSPAVLVCLDSLVRLHHDLSNTPAKLTMHIHDGYVIATPQPKNKSIRDLAVKSLETESAFFPELKLKISSHTGVDFNSLV